MLDNMHNHILATSLKALQCSLFFIHNDIIVDEITFPEPKNNKERILYYGLKPDSAICFLQTTRWDKAHSD
jgi:hypothetical protein